MEKKKARLHRQRRYITESPEETQQIAKHLAKELSSGAVITLHGELGGGKTTFVQGLARGLAIKKRIISPTFVLIRQYKLGIKYFYHIDLYRVESQQGLEGLGLEEIINDQDNIVVIEWAEKMGKLLPQKRIDVSFRYIGELKREVKVVNYE